MKKKVSFTECIKEIFSISPQKFILQYCFSAIDGIALALTAWAMQQLFSEIVLLSEHNSSILEIIKFLAILLSLYIISEIGNGVSSYLGEMTYAISEQKLHKNINKKMGKLYALDFENPSLLNKYEQVYRGAMEERQFVNTLMDIIMYYGPYFLVYGVYLFSLQGWLLLIVPFTFFPMLVSQFIKARIYIEYEEEIAPILRKETSYQSYVTEKDYIKETRLWDKIPYLMKKYIDARYSRNEKERNVKKKTFRLDMLTTLIQFSGYAASIILLIYFVFIGRIEISAFAAIISSIGLFTDQLKELVEGRCGELAEDYAIIKHYQDFKDIVPFSEKQNEVEQIEYVQLKGVSFSYPDGKKAVDNIDFEAKRGEIIAVVGENGSGKTTLARLITGLYLPTEGFVSYGNKKTSELNYQTLQKYTSAVFQNFRKYNLTLYENISMLKKVSQEKIYRDLIKAGIDISGENFSDGVNTLLGRDFGGIELSGGQWQRVAIARGICKESSLIVLDEPTSAIDPLQEQNLYHTFLETSEGKIAFIVTHRLGLARLCSKIVVLQNGTINNVGTHEELLLNSDYYKKLWEAQSNQYSSL